MDPVRILSAILLPQLAVFLQVGLGLQFWIGMRLARPGYDSGGVHAL